MKTDMMASTKKSKRQKKRRMDVRGDAHPDTTEQEADEKALAEVRRQLMLARPNGRHRAA